MRVRMRSLHKLFMFRFGTDEKVWEILILLKHNNAKLESFWASPQTPMGELTALPHTPYLGAEGATPPPAPPLLYRLLNTPP